MKGIILARCWPRQSYGGTKQTEHIYGTARANISTVRKDGVNMRCEVVTTQVFTVLGLLVGLGIIIEKPKGSLEAYTYISNFPL